ncbi:MAG: MATE family efflux transporter, partial [Bryobacteraceae bacterium]
MLAFLREALRGNTHRDFTQERIGRAIALLAIPMVLEMSMESLFAVVDMFWVAHLGADAVAAIGLTETVESLLYAVAMGMSVAATAVVARRIGEKNLTEAGRSAAQAILLGLVVAAACSVAGAWFAPEVLRAMGATGSIVDIGAGYTRMIFAGDASVVLLFLVNAVFRGAGDAALAMRVLWIANLINIVLNPLLIFGVGFFPRLGVLGSGVGTTIGRSIGVLIQVWYLKRHSSRVTVRARDFLPDFRAIWRLARLSAGGVFQYFAGMASWIALVRMVAEFGGAAVAGYTVAMRIFMFAILPSWGMANAAATLVGQNLGAHSPDRAERSVWRTGLYNMIFLGIVTAAFVWFAGPLVSIFTQDREVVAIGSDALRLMSYGYVFFAWGMVMVQAFNGAGDTYTPTTITILSNWVFQIPLAWWLTFKLNLGANGVFLSIALASS